MSKLCLGKQAFSSLLNAGSAQRLEPVPNHSGLALAASEAGRTARADARTTVLTLVRFQAMASEARISNLDLCSRIFALPNVIWTSKLQPTHIQKNPHARRNDYRWISYVVILR